MRITKRSVLIGVSSVAMLAILAASVFAFHGTSHAIGTGVQVVSVVRVNGNDQSYGPGVSLARNLDSTPLLAGMTRYDPDGPGPHLVYWDTFAGFLWQGMPPGATGPIAGHMHIFYISPPSLYTTPSRYAPAAIADNQTVVGTVAWRLTRTSAPWEWTPTDGLSFLPIPDSNWQGTARAVSDDGTTAAGTIWYGRFGPHQAVTWSNGVRTALGTTSPWSEVDAMSPDGNTIVGSAGANGASAQAARWVNGQQTVLASVNSATQSTAMFTSHDGNIAVGTATLSPALTLLVRWDANGQPQVLTPPNGLSVDRVTAINPDATAIVGSLVQYTGCTPGGPGPICNGNQVPFLWTSQDGFTLLPENGLGDFYDMSTSVGVSDDGKTVVGELISSTSYDGAPHPAAFVWNRTTGEIMLNTLMSNAGYNYELFGAVAISGSGTKIVATGDVQPTSNNDTDSVILTLSGLG